MFGHKNANSTDALFHFREQPRMHKAPASKDVESAPVGTPIEVLVRKETYFAMSRSSRWNQ